MAKFVKSLKWRRWSGPLTAIVDATDAAANELRVWTGNESTATVEVALPQLVMHFTSVHEFARDLPAYELPSLQSVRITASAYADAEKGSLVGPRSAVSFRLQKADPSLSIEIDGTDRVRVEGLAARMRQTLDHAQTGPPIRSEDFMWIIPFGYLFGLILVFVGFPKLALSSLITPVAAGVLTMVVGNRIFPGLELLAPGQSSRYQRFRVVAAGVVLALIASWIFAAGQNLIHT